MSIHGHPVLRLMFMEPGGGGRRLQHRKNPTSGLDTPVHAVDTAAGRPQRATWKVLGPEACYS